MIPNSHLVSRSQPSLSDFTVLIGVLSFFTKKKHFHVCCDGILFVFFAAFFCFLVRRRLHFTQKKIEIGLPNEWSGTTATTSQVQPLTEETKLNRQAAPQSVCRADFSTHKKKRKKRSITYLDVYPI
jgi:hypothetical protein